MQILLLQLNPWSMEYADTVKLFLDHLLPKKLTLLHAWCAIICRESPCPFAERKTAHSNSAYT